MILYSRWCALSLPTRNKFAEIFGIIKKGSTEVASNVLKYDGYVVEDIENAITVEAMQKYLSADNTDITELWNMTIAKIEGKEVEGIIQSKPSVPVLEVLPTEEAKQFAKEHKERKMKAVKKIVVKKLIKTKNAKTKK